MERLYYNLPKPTTYAGADKLLTSTRKRYTKRQVIDWLESQDAYNSHKLVRRRFPRRIYNAENIDDVWEADLMDVRSLSTYNDNYTYLLACIDVLGKFAWVEALLDKTSKSVARAFERILSRCGNRKPKLLQSDLGKEFVGADMQKTLKNHDITYRVVRNPDTKAAIVERFIRTFKERMYRYFTHKKTRRYVDVLQQIVESYNNSKHSAIKMIPALVNSKNAAEVRSNLQHKYGDKIPIREPKYSVGDLVRISRARNIFAKGYEGGWTVELFKISGISRVRHPHVYFLKDLADEEIGGFFYEEELSRVKKDLDKEVFEIDQVLETRGRGANRKFLVSWVGFPAKFNSWVYAKDVKKLQ